MPLGQIVACPQPERVFVIGVEAIAYSPHYNFVEPNMPNFFGDFVKWLTTKTQCKFSVKALPIKRLKAEFELTQNIDFMYPDNSNWHLNQDNDNRIYSESIVVALGGTIVSKAHENIAIDEFNSLAFPRGFSPVAWYPHKHNYDINFVETSTALAALQMVITDRVDGADVEYNVAQYIKTQEGLPELVMAKRLPFTPTSFHLSTFSQGELMQYINQVIQQNRSEISQLKANINLVETLP